MPKATVNLGTFIKVPKENVFGHVSDLTRHGEWSADPVRIEAISDDPIALGKEYRSVANFRGSDVKGDIEVTGYEPPSRFAFQVKDSQGTHVHEFSFRTDGGGTRMDREVVMDVSFSLWVLIKTVGCVLIGKPGMKKAYEQLRAKLEK